MAIEILHNSNHVLIEFNYLESGESWYLTFDKDLKIAIHSFWRFLQNGKISWTSKDHNQDYGLLEPIDLQIEIVKLLNNESLLKIERNNLTGDLFLEFSSNYSIEIFTDSSGYESWEVDIGKRMIIGMAQGEIADFK